MDALDTYDVACLHVAALVSGVVAGNPNQTQRFYVELAPGETTVVSWKALVYEANNEVVSADFSDKALVQKAHSEVDLMNPQRMRILWEIPSKLVNILFS